MSVVASYKDLLVWQRSMNLVEAVYRATGRMPSNEQWGLSAQARRAAVSVPCNIAEGYGRQATGDYRHHLSIARGSLLELETQILLCQRLALLSAEDTEALPHETTQIAKMLGALISKIR